MTAESLIPENIQSLLDHADLSLLRGKHGQASTFLWKATEAAIWRWWKLRFTATPPTALSSSLVYWRVPKSCNALLLMAVWSLTLLLGMSMRNKRLFQTKTKITCGSGAQCCGLLLFGYQCGGSGSRQRLYTVHTGAKRGIWRLGVVFRRIFAASFR